MKAFLVVGSTGTGKTTFVKKLLTKSTCRKFIYDINKEYTEFKNEYVFSSDFSNFSDVTETKRNCIIVYEEATIFFSNKGSDKLTTGQLVRKRHTNNILVFVFHSLRTVPLHIFDLIDFLVLHKTGDNIKLIERKFDGNEKVLNSFFEVQQSKNKYEEKIISLR